MTTAARIIGNSAYYAVLIFLGITALSALVSCHWWALIGILAGAYCWQDTFASDDE
jgi:hypothetical protein